MPQPVPPVARAANSPGTPAPTEPSAAAKEGAEQEASADPAVPTEAAEPVEIDTPGPAPGLVENAPPRTWTPGVEEQPAGELTWPGDPNSPGAVAWEYSKFEDRAMVAGGASTDQWRAWREKLLEAGRRGDPNDSDTAEAFCSAANISGWLGEVERKEEELRACLSYPVLNATSRVLALEDAASIAGYLRDDIVQAFADYNAMVATIEKMEPELREKWQYVVYRVLIDKGRLLSGWRARRQSSPALPGADAGKEASDFFQEFLDLPAEARDHPAFESETPFAFELHLMAMQARALVDEGQGERAAQVYERIGQHPENPYSHLWLGVQAATARHGEGTRGYLRALEEVERAFPCDAGSKWLSAKIAFWHLRAGSGREYIARMEPRFGLPGRGAAPTAPLADEARAVLFMLAEANMKSDVRDYARAIEYYEAFLAGPEPPGTELRNSAFQALECARELLEFRIRREQQKGETDDERDREK